MFFISPFDVQHQLFLTFIVWKSLPAWFQGIRQYLLWPPSRPKPLSFMPPKGAAAAVGLISLMPTIPNV
jgi:hypothetical protein